MHKPAARKPASPSTRHTRPAAMTPDDFSQLLQPLARQLAGRALDAELDRWLNAEHGPGSATYQAITAACHTGIAEGWLCQREGGGTVVGGMGLSPRALVLSA